ncbi:formyltransferase family protein [Endozoicomonas ascidiicola]|uniref:formyltransferase family protein n=1 Tax=Endozoicomonas ascidiicola TaxID=1698521 RepID=UPI0008377832|nr:formyltransferase family protein [Endozoicomonas ascidiicola]
MLKILFMGRKKVAADALSYLLSLDNIEVVGVLTDSHLDVSPTNDVAKRNGLTVFEFSEALTALKLGSLSFDLGVSVLYWRKLIGEFLSTPTLGVINFHPAPLPDYKGTAGYNMAIMDDLEEWGVSSHYMDENIDTGGIIDVVRFAISKNTETAKTLEAKSQPFLYDLFVKNIGEVVKARGFLKAISNVGGRYFSRMDMEAMKEVKPDDDVSKKIRAFWFPPYDGAFQYINGVKCTLVDDFILKQLADPTTSSLFTGSS